MLLNLIRELNKRTLKFVLLIVIVFVSKYTLAARVSNLVEPVNYHVNHNKELNRIDAGLASFGRVSLVGISGIGKTQLARLYANNNKQKYDLIWFFDCNVDLAPQFVNLAQAINNITVDSHKIAEGISEASRSVQSYLNQNNKNQFLFIIDNLKINNNHNSQIFLDWQNNGHIIFCSQDASLLPNIINIPYLSHNASEELIRLILSDFPSDFVTRLASELKGYPITTAKSAIFLDSNKYITIEEYEKHLKISSDNMNVYVDFLISKLNDSTKKLLYEIVFFNNQSLSKSLIKKLSDKNTFIEDLINLNRYQVLSLKYNDDDIKIFELHDRLKEAIIMSMDTKLLNMILSSSVDKVNGFIPKGKNTKQELILNDDTIISSLEELLKNAEKYEVSTEKIFELKKNLMSFYLGMGVTRCQELADWLMVNKDKILQNHSNNHTKAVYAEFLVLIGVYDYFINADYSSAMEHLHNAEKIIGHLPEYQDLKYLVFSQLAQAYVYNADMERTLQYIKKARTIDTREIGIELDATLLRYVESKYFLSKGEYDKSLEAINGFIEIIKDHPVDYYFAPIYVMKATILNYTGDYQTSYKIAKDIYDKEIKEISVGNAGGIRLRVIIELSRAELGLNLLTDSLRHANQAINVYKNNESRKNLDLNASSDIDFADAFIAQADSLQAVGKTKEAIESYSIAESIYYNKYKKRIGNLNEVSVLYQKAALAAHSIKNQYWFNKYKKRHLGKFGLEHPGSKLILQLPQL